MVLELIHVDPVLFKRNTCTVQPIIGEGNGILTSLCWEGHVGFQSTAHYHMKMIRPLDDWVIGPPLLCTGNNSVILLM